MTEKQALVPVGAIVRNPSPSQSAVKLPTKPGKSQVNSFDLNSVHTPSNMETLGVKLSAKTAHLADDVSLSRITR